MKKSRKLFNVLEVMIVISFYFDPDVADVCQRNVGKKIKMKMNDVH